MPGELRDYLSAEDVTGCGGPLPENERMDDDALGVCARILDGIDRRLARQDREDRQAGGRLAA